MPIKRKTVEFWTNCKSQKKNKEQEPQTNPLRKTYATTNPSYFSSI